MFLLNWPVTHATAHPNPPGKGRWPTGHRAWRQGRPSEHIAADRHGLPTCWADVHDKCKAGCPATPPESRSRGRHRLCSRAAGAAADRGWCGAA